MQAYNTDEEDISTKFSRRCETDPQGVINDLLKMLTEQAKLIQECRAEGLGPFAQALADGKIKGTKAPKKSKSKSKSIEQEG